MNPAVRAIGRAALAAHPITLQEVTARAELLARFDHSYLVPLDVFEEFAARLTDPHRPGGGFRALSIDGKRWFAYHSVYFDTSGLRTFHDHRQGRRLRFRVRERLYRDSGERQFEIKLKGRRGETVKHRRLLTGDEKALGVGQLEFLSGVLREAYGIDAPARLTPSLVTDYHRATFVAEGQRVTCDAGLVVREAASGRSVVADSGLVLVETKTRGHLTEADRMLHRLGVRAADFTKYAAGFAALRPGLGINRWARTVSEVFPGARSVPAGR
ncbi:VTC domain-containing protein [Streptomyces sp. NBC_01304]|uniref:VTC domain-containing protein n=1 Tax=Streptomyces sp. NBC_01304 TaxID=2903818 RepID=UPI002E110FDE|nr:VTC domain-containing protein [Streptomyces sp. NBC_01304]